MAKSEKEYISKQILKIFGLKMEKFRDLHNRKYIVPTIPSAGHGQKAFYSLEDIYGIALFLKLVDKGFKREVASELVNSIRYPDGLSPLLIADFVLYKTVIKDGERKLIPAYQHGGDYSIHLSPEKIEVTPTGFTGGEKTDMAPAAAPYDFWEDFFAVNLIQLRVTVDKALATAE